VSSINMELPLPNDRVLAGMVALHDYWKRLPEGHPRKSLDPVELGPALLPHVTVGHILDGGNIMRYDLISSRLQLVAPRLYPGALSTDPLELEGTSYDLIHDILTTTAKTQSPSALHVQFNSLEQVHRQVFLLLLPLDLRPGAPCCEDLIIGLWDLSPKERLLHERRDDLTGFFLDHVSRLTD